MGGMLCAIKALQHRIAELVVHQELSQLLRDAGPMLRQIWVVKLHSSHGAASTLEGSGWSWLIGVVDTQRLHDLRYLRDVSVRNGGFAIASWFPDGSTCKFRVTLVVCINGHALREYLLTVSCLIMFVPCYAIVTLIAPNVHDLCWDSAMTLVNSVGTPKWNKQPVGWWYLAIWTYNSQIKKMDNIIPYV